MNEELVDRFNTDHGPEENWTRLGHSLVMDGEMEVLRNLFNARHREGRQAMDFAFHLFLDVLGREEIRSAREKIAAGPTAAWTGSGTDDAPPTERAPAPPGAVGAELLVRVIDDLAESRDIMRLHVLPRVPARDLPVVLVH